MVKIELSGGNEFVAYNSLEEAIKAAAEWYDYLAADGRVDRRGLSSLAYRRHHRC